MKRIKIGYGAKPPRRASDTISFESFGYMLADVWPASIHTSMTLMGSLEKKVLVVELLSPTHTEDYVEIDGILYQIIFKNHDEELLYVVKNKVGG